MLLDAVARLGVVLIVLAGAPVAVCLFWSELRETRQQVIDEANGVSLH